MRRAFGLLMAAGLVAAGCGLPFGGKSLPSTSDLVNGAADGFAKAKGLEINGTFVQNSFNYTIDMQISPPSDAHLTMTQNSLQIESEQVSGKVFYRGRDFVASVLGTSAANQQIAKAVGDRWFTSKSAAPIDLSGLSDPTKVKANFLSTVSVKRKDNVSSSGVNTAELTGDDYILNITEATPYRLVFLRTAPGKTVQEMTQANLTFSNYDKDFAIVAPTNVFDVDDHSTWPPMYVYSSINNSKCDDPCILSADFQNSGGMTGASAPSTATFSLTNKADGSDLGSCKGTIQPDVANGSKVTVSCSITSSAWTAFRVVGGTYIYKVVADNPAYD
jgi:hypothetical protein